MSKQDQRHAGLNLGDHGELSHDRAEQDVFGFWIFLMSDALLFALLFATYGAMLAGTAGGPTPADSYKLMPAFVETLVLLTSSLSYGLASVTLKHDPDNRRALVFWLGVTLLLGLAFLALEAHDFADMAAAGAVPQRSGFLSAFFALVPLHGLHVIGGSLWLMLMIGQVLTIGLDARTKVNLLRLGLFWHFLDIVWIAIFSVVYLQGLLR
jgi:cytochrome o ubiquinol oxidase subunit 3